MQHPYSQRKVTGKASAVNSWLQAYQLLRPPCFAAVGTARFADWLPRVLCRCVTGLGEQMQARPGGYSRRFLETSVLDLEGWLRGVGIQRVWQG